MFEAPSHFNSGPKPVRPHSLSIPPKPAMPSSDLVLAILPTKHHLLQGIGEQDFSFWHIAASKKDNPLKHRNGEAPVSSKAFIYRGP